jgi:hypothetical protein
MAEKHVISALMERRARLAGELRAKQLEVKRMQKALASIDLCIRMFKADYQPGSIAPKVRSTKAPPSSPKGGQPKALEILRETEEAPHGTAIGSPDPRAGAKSRASGQSRCSRRRSTVPFLGRRILS